MRVFLYVHINLVLDVTVFMSLLGSKHHIIVIAYEHDVTSMYVLCSMRSTGISQLEKSR